MRRGDRLEWSRQAFWQPSNLRNCGTHDVRLEPRRRSGYLQRRRGLGFFVPVQTAVKSVEQVKPAAADNAAAGFLVVPERIR